MSINEDMDNNQLKFLQIKSMQNDLSKYLNEIKKRQIENNDLIEKIKQVKKINTNNNNNKDEDQFLIFDNIQKQINNLSKRCENTENILTCLNNIFNNFSDLISNLNDCLKTQQKQQPIDYSQPRYDNSMNDETPGHKDNDLNYLEYVSELERPYDTANFNFQNGHMYSTQEISNLLKETLIKYKISQQLFAETILNMKQANLSALLSQPNSWDTLTQINRNRFLTIFMWLQDPRKLEKINFMKSKLSLNNDLKSFEFNNNNNINNINNNNNNSKNGTNNKRQRIVLSKYQQDRLRSLFNQNAYPSSDDIDLLSIELNLSSKKISTWFTHQRQINKFVKINFM